MDEDEYAYNEDNDPILPKWEWDGDGRKYAQILRGWMVLMWSQCSP